MPPTPAGDIAIGAYVEVGAGRGYVRFAGATQFAPGKWVGVELDKPNGKNDGSVAGVHYFDSTPLHGVFVRPSQAKVVARPPATNNIVSPPPYCYQTYAPENVYHLCREHLSPPPLHAHRLSRA